MTTTNIRYARTSDGMRIAYATEGAGPPLLIARQFLSPRVDEDHGGWGAPWRADFPREHAVTFWDSRGTGLSTTGASLTLESGIEDLRAVADAAKIDRFDLIGYLTPAHVAWAFAARFPDRVRRLVLWNPAIKGLTPETNLGDHITAMAETHWDDFVDLLLIKLYGWERASLGARTAMRIKSEFTSESWRRMMGEMKAIDATPELPRVQAPTLVVFDQNFPVRPAGAEFIQNVAAAIPNAELVRVKPADYREYAREAIAFFARGAAEAPEAMAPSPAQGTAVILFTDIVDSTALTERLGDAAFRDASRALDASMRGAMREAGATPVEGKVLGDGVMAVFASAAQAIDAARRCVTLSASTDLRLHVGIHAGDVIREADNVYGGAVNLAARICGLCEPGEILVSATIRDLARTSAGVTFADRGEHALKGIEDAVRVYAVQGVPDVA